MARLRWPSTDYEPPREPPLEPLSSGETWRWSVATVGRSPLLFATVCLVGAAVGAVVATIQQPVAIVAILLGYVVQTAIAAAYVAEVAESKEAGRPARAFGVLRTGLGRLRDVALTAVVLVIVHTVVVEATVFSFESLVHPLHLIQVGVLVALVLVVRSAFVGPMAVIDGRPPVQAILDGWLLAGEDTSQLLSLHVLFVLGATPVGLGLFLAPSAAVVALAATTICAFSGLLALCLARTYVVCRHRHEFAERSRTPAWKLEGAPAVRR